MLDKRDNICNFIPSAEIDTEINALNFVYETAWDKDYQVMNASHVLLLVTSGTGDYITPSFRYTLTKGDLVIILSAKPYTLINHGDLKFCYISFIGARVHPLYDRLRISYTNSVFHGYDSIIPFWLESVKRVKNYNSDLVAHSVLYYTFSHIAADAYKHSKPSKHINIITDVKRYIDTHYNDPALSLSMLSNHFGYSSKYISDRFSRTMTISISGYIASRRLERAREMITETKFSVAQIANLCGYRDPLYFSKVYKQTFGHSPASEMRDVRGNDAANESDTTESFT